MLLKPSFVEPTSESDGGTNGYFNPRYRARSTSNLLSPDSVVVQSTLLTASATVSRSSTPSPASSISSLAASSNTKSNIPFFLKRPLSNRKTVAPVSDIPTEDRFIMTLIKSPSASAQRIHSTSCSDIGGGSPVPPPTTTTTSEEASISNKFFKGKVTAALNHMKYRWVVRMQPNFRTNESPIYLLGKIYNGKEETSYDDSPRSYSDQSYTSFLTAFSQRIYLSYRKQFEPLMGLTRSGDSITSDCGWGCMIRCAQMLLAQTLIVHMIPSTINTTIQMSDKCPKRNSIEYLKHPGHRINRRLQTHTDIIRLFGDFPNAKCPFGIHKIVEIGTTHGIRPGDFFGPVSAAHCLKEALEAAVEANQIPDTLRIYISQDAIIYRQDVIDLCSAPSSNPNSTPNSQKKSSLYPSLHFTSSVISSENESNSSYWTSALLILVPLRLGLNELDLIYEPYLKEALKLPHTVGIIGGSPRHAVYILGFQDDSFIDLDPHFSQTTVNVLDETFDSSSYSCSSPKKLTAKKMDPSCTLGFYCRDRADFEIFCAQWNHISHMTTNDRRSCPIFRIERGTLQESHTRTLNFDYPSLNEDENVFLRVTKLPSSSNSSPSTNNHHKKFSNHNSKSCLSNSTTTNVTNRDSWDDAGQTLNDSTTGHHGNRLYSLSDDYVFL